LSELTFQTPLEKKPHGYWTVEGEENTRLFFDDYAKAHGFDPLVAENWYSITRQKVLAFRVISFICLDICLENVLEEAKINHKINIYQKINIIKIGKEIKGKINKRKNT
jgi:hypothetical protein